MEAGLSTAAIARTLGRLKRPVNLDASLRLPVTLGVTLVAYLRPVRVSPHDESSSDARLMAAWRNQHHTAFFSWFTATEESTRRWLAESYAPDDLDIMFMLETPDRRPFGHVALYNFSQDGTECEFGRILRGPDAHPAGGMALGSLTLLRWAAAELRVRRFSLEVFRDNHKAIALYDRLGFTVVRTLPLRRIETGGTVRWEKMAPTIAAETAADGYALRMATTADRLHAPPSFTPQR